MCFRSGLARNPTEFFRDLLLTRFVLSPTYVKALAHVEVPIVASGLDFFGVVVAVASQLL